MVLCHMIFLCFGRKSLPAVTLYIPVECALDF